MQKAPELLFKRKLLFKWSENISSQKCVLNFDPLSAKTAAVEVKGGEPKFRVCQRLSYEYLFFLKKKKRKAELWGATVPAVLPGGSSSCSEALFVGANRSSYYHKKFCFPCGQLGVNPALCPVVTWADQK